MSCCIRRSFQTKLLPIIIEMATIYLALQDPDLVPETQIICLKGVFTPGLFSEVVSFCRLDVFYIFVGRIETVKSYFSKESFNQIHSNNPICLQLDFSIPI